MNLLWFIGTILFQVQTSFGQVGFQFPIVTKPATQAERLVQLIRLDVEAGETERAQSQIEQLRSEHQGQLVRFEKDRLIEAGLLADILTHQLVDNPVARIRPEHDYSVWRQLLTSANTTEEVLQAGDDAWSAGDLKKARECWGSLEAFGRVDGGATANARLDRQLQIELSKRLIVLDAIAGRLRRSNQRLAEFANQFPDERGRLAGREGVLTDLLVDWIEIQRSGSSDDFLADLTPLPFKKGRFSLVRQDWATALNSSEDQGDLTCWNGLLLLHDQQGLRALNSKTGTSAWPVDDRDEGFLIQVDPLTDGRKPVRFAEGGVIVDETWIGRTGTSQFVENRIRDEFQRSRLIALDLDAEGRIQWTVSADELIVPQSTSRWIFSGTPVRAGDNVIAPLRSSQPDHQLKLVCLNHQTGRIIWQETIGATLGDDLDASPYFNGKLLVQGNYLYWNVNRDAIICVAVDTGKTQWVKAFAPLPKSFFWQPQNEVQQNSGAMISAGQKIVSSTIQGIVSIDVHTGETNWIQFLLHPPRKIVEENDGIIVACDPGIAAYDSESGDQLWSYDFPRNPSVIFFGRSLICATGTELWTIDSHTGCLLQRDFYEQLTNQACRAVLLRDSTLLVAGNESLSAFSILQYAKRVVQDWNLMMHHGGTEARRESE